MMPDKTSLCSKLEQTVSKQIWEIFMWLDVDSQNKIHVEDICDLVQRILLENKRSESEQNIKEWFGEELLVDFWSFFAGILENCGSFLKVRK